LETGKDFWLGGIKIPSDRGAVGHSDADVLIHAICDALLGAANLHDIGYHYSNKDPRWKGKDSKFFLDDVTPDASEKGWKIEMSIARYVSKSRRSVRTSMKIKRYWRH